MNVISCVLAVGITKSRAAHSLVYGCGGAGSSCLNGCTRGRLEVSMRQVTELQPVMAVSQSGAPKSAGTAALQHILVESRQAVMVKVWGSCHPHDLSL